MDCPFRRMGCYGKVPFFITFGDNLTAVRLLAFLVLNLAFCVCVRAQVSAPFSFTHYRASDGLASNEVHGTIQDRTGYLWIATNRGLQRYDGVQYKSFQHRVGDPSSLPENVIVQILLESDYTLWVLTARGHVGIFDKNKFTYRDVPVRTKPGTPPSRNSWPYILYFEARSPALVPVSARWFTSDTASEVRRSSASCSSRSVVCSSCATSTRPSCSAKARAVP